MKPTYSENDQDIEHVIGYLSELQSQHEQEISNLKLVDWCEIFPEAADIIPLKITEWEEVVKKLKNRIKVELTAVRKSGTNEVSQQLARELLKASCGYELVQAQLHVQRLKNESYRTHRNDGKRTEVITQIANARTVDISQIASIHTKLRKAGRNFVGLCPLHNEKTPSFHIYTETNSYWCFGCQQGGDVINLAMKAGRMDFLQAVKFLNEVDV